MAKLLVHHLGFAGEMQAAVSFLVGDGATFTPNFTSSPVDIQTNVGVTPLMLSCRKAHYQLVEMLVKGGANVQAVDNKGETTVIYAAAAKRFKTPPNADSAPEIFMVCPFDHYYHKCFRMTPKISSKLTWYLLFGSVVFRVKR